MSIKPLTDRVLLKPVKAEDKTPGGIIIPAMAQQKTQQATVVAIGDSKDIKVKVGDVVFHDMYAGVKIEIEREEHVIVRMDDIIATVSEDKKDESK